MKFICVVLDCIQIHEAHLLEKRTGSVCKCGEPPLAPIHMYMAEQVPSRLEKLSIQRRRCPSWWPKSSPIFNMEGSGSTSGNPSGLGRFLYFRICSEMPFSCCHFSIGSCATHCLLMLKSG